MIHNSSILKSIDRSLAKNWQHLIKSYAYIIHVISPSFPNYILSIYQSIENLSPFSNAVFYGNTYVSIFSNLNFFYFFDPEELNIKFINLQSVFITFICQYLMNYFVIHFHGEKGLMLKNSQTPCWYPDPSIMEEQNLEVPIVLARGYNLKKSHKNYISSLNAHNFWYLHKTSNFVRNLLP